jgi:hypothetical protein
LKTSKINEILIWRRKNKNLFVDLQIGSTTLFGRNFVVEVKIKFWNIENALKVCSVGT